MATQLSTLISQELNIPINQVAGTVNLLDDGATIPFISRYRKEATGDLDELSIQSIDQRLRYYRELEKRRATILKTIEAQDKLTPELADSINNCWLPGNWALSRSPRSSCRSMVAILRDVLASLLTVTRCLTPMPLLLAPRTSLPSG